jgi:hypothetical protein
MGVVVVKRSYCFMRRLRDQVGYKMTLMVSGKRLISKVLTLSSRRDLLRSKVSDNLGSQATQDTEVKILIVQAS